MNRMRYEWMAEMVFALALLPALALAAAEPGEPEILARLGRAGENVSCGADFRDFKPEVPAGVLDARRFVAVALRSSLPERLRTVAVAKDGAVALLPDDFDKLVSSDFKRDFDAPKALALAKAWLVTKAPTRDAFEVIDNPAAPQYNQARRGRKAVDVAKLTSPPSVETTAEGFKVTLCSWRKTGGSVDLWTLDISPQAGITKVAERNVASAAGQYEAAN